MTSSSGNLILQVMMNTSEESKSISLEVPGLQIAMHYIVNGTVFVPAYSSLGSVSIIKEFGEFVNKLFSKLDFSMYSFYLQTLL